jgi:hypothetical protein
MTDKPKTPKAPPRRITTMRLRTDLLNPFDAEAMKRGLSRTALLEQVVATWLNQIGRKTKLDPKL